MTETSCCGLVIWWSWVALTCAVIVWGGREE